MAMDIFKGWPLDGALNDNAKPKDGEGIIAGMAIKKDANGELVKADHPAHELYKTVEESVAGVSCGCADVFGAAETAQRGGFDLIQNNMAPGTTGLPSLRALAADGYNILIF